MQRTKAAGPTAVRVAAKAIIIDGGRLLTVKVRDLLHPDEYYYGLPGGGQQPGENLHAALVRECEEEIGMPVRVGELLFVRDYIGPNHRRAAVDGRFHQLELMFACRLPPEAGREDVGRGTAPDPRQIGVRWIPLEELSRYNFRPGPLVPRLQQGSPSSPVYLGDVD